MTTTTDTKQLTINDRDYLLNGSPIQIISGSLSYFRMLPEQWDDRLAKLAALGANTVEIYIPWNLHEPTPGSYNFSHRLDLPQFLDRAAAHELLVLFRPGPYICGEWDFGGLPWWLLNEPNTQLRSSDPAFLKHVDAWFEKLIPAVTPYLGSNGGPIVATQIENEFGYFGHDPAYLNHLKNKLQSLGIDTLLFTSDGTYEPHQQANGGLPDCLRTANFGSDPDSRLAELRKSQPTGPLTCMEFWVGWFDAWHNQAKSTRDPHSVTQDLATMLAANASANIFVFHGGTSFGFTSGANLADTYQPHVTSYDYDGLLTEAGDITPKYLAVRDTIAQHTNRTDLNLSFDPSPKLALNDIPFTHALALNDALPAISNPVSAAKPLPIEQLGYGSGYVLYRAQVPASYARLPLRLRGMHDYAHILLDNQPLAHFYRNDPHPDITLDFDTPAAQLDVVVDCMARANFGHRCTTEHKGIADNIYFGPKRHDERALAPWQSFPLPMDNLDQLPWDDSEEIGEALHGPRFYRATFNIDSPADTFLHLPQFTKGFALINGFNLGRYWSVGPQHTLYIPAPLLQPGTNELVVFELIETHNHTHPLNAHLLPEPIWAT